MSDAYTVKAAESLFAGPTGRTSLTMQSDPGDYVGQGRTYTLDSTTGRFSNYRFSSDVKDGIRIDYYSNEFPTDGSWWMLSFSAPQGAKLGTGVYQGATRDAFAVPGTPGLEIFGEGRGSNQLTGEFEVRAFDFDDAAAIALFDATFEQHSEGGSPALRGQILYNVSSDIPGVLANDSGGGGAAVRAVLVTSPTHGRISLRDDGSFTYRPNSDYSGVDSFQYSVTDGLQTSAPATVMINVEAPAPAKLAFVGTVANAVAGQSLVVRVAVQDAGGNVNAMDEGTTVVLEVDSGPGVFSGASSAKVVNGIATFPAIAFDVAGQYTLRARGGQVAATSNAFLVSPAAPAGLSITRMPTSAQAGVPIQPLIQASVVDRFGNVVPTSPSRTVAIEVASGPAGFASTRTTTVRTVAGTATFNALMLRRPGAYVFRLTSAGLPAVISASLPVFAPSRLTLHATPPRSVVNAPVTLTAHLTVGRYVVGMPRAGLVTFFTGDAVLGTANLVGGKARLKLKSLPQGVHPIRAVFNGSEGFLESGSDVLAYAVGPHRRSGRVVF